MPAGAGRAASLLPLILAGLLAGVSYWLELASRAPAGANDGKSRHDPDYFVENFEVRRFDPEGKLQHTLFASLMRHYPDDDTTVVLAPDLTYHRVPPTRVTAREAHISSEGKHVQLIDDVRIVRGAAGGKPETVLTTARLDVVPDDETASNNVPVTITQGLSRINGSALRADNKSATYVLEGPVRGIFHRDSGAMRAPSPRIEGPADSQPVVKAQPKAKPVKKARPVKKTSPGARKKSKPQTKPQP